MPVNSLHPDYARLLPQWQRARDATEGEEAVKAKGRQYLIAPDGMRGEGPKDQEHLLRKPQRGGYSSDYAMYIDGAEFYGASQKTVEAFVGLIMRKEPINKYPPRLAPVVDDMTLDGQSLSDMQMQAVDEVIRVSRYGLLVEYPRGDKLPPDMMASDFERLGMRPYTLAYVSEAAINWRVEVIGGVRVLTMLVLKEQDELTSDDEFACERRDQYKVLWLRYQGAADGQAGRYVYQQEVWTAEDENGEKFTRSETITPLHNGQPLAFIPFFPMPSFQAFFSPRPSLIQPLVALNFKHYRNSADMAWGLHFTGLPQPYVTGVEPGIDDNGQQQMPEFKLGSSQLWFLTAPNATAEYMQVDAGGFAALRQEIQDKEHRMSVLGARMLERDKASAESYETVAMRRQGEHASLGSIAMAVSDRFTEVLQFMAEWAGVPGEIECALNRDFELQTMAPQMAAEQMRLWQGGAIDKRTLYENLQKGEVANPDRSFEEMEENREAEAEEAMRRLPAALQEMAGQTGDQDEDESGDEDGEDDDDDEPAPTTPAGIANV